MTPLSINLPNDPLTPTVVADLARDCHADSVSKGWWEPLDTPAQEATREAMRADLIGSEVGEALDALRRPERPLAYLDDKGKPDGYLVEVADVAIRALDLLGRVISFRSDESVYMGWIASANMEKDVDFHKVTSWHHRVWGVLVWIPHRSTNENYSQLFLIRRLTEIIFMCEEEAVKHNADLLHLITLKRDFNRTRPTRHGGLSV